LLFSLLPPYCCQYNCSRHHSECIQEGICISAQLRLWLKVVSPECRLFCFTSRN
jgi:hypothetical protein